LTLALIFVRVASLFIIWVKSVQRHRFYSRGQGQRSKVSCHQNLITFRVHQNTFVPSYVNLW